MFAIPGIFGVVFFIYLRPQEAYTSLQGIPFLNLFFALTLFGAAVDLRLRVTRAIPMPQLPWVVVFFLWALLTVAVMKPDDIVGNAINLFIVVAIFTLIAQSVQSFRVFERLCTLIIGLTLILTGFAIYQSVSPRQCVIQPANADSLAGIGIPDGRPCDYARMCYDAQSDPGAEYICEKVGVLGTHAQGDRVRYRGILQDPNELAACMSAGFALLLGLWVRKRTTLLGFVTFVGFVAVAWGVKETGSRSGQLGLLASLGVFLLWRYGLKLALIGGPFAIPILMLMAKGGSERGDADESSELRYNAWRAGLDMFRDSPVLGVGYGQFTNYHFLTAHNSYVLILGELGIVGIFIFTMLIWISIKTPLHAIKRFAGHPEARVAEVWSVAVLAALSAILCGGLFLSFSYHYLLWIFLGLSGGLFLSIKKHDPAFTVPLTAVDAATVAIFDVVLYIVIQVFLRYKGL